MDQYGNPVFYRLCRILHCLPDHQFHTAWSYGGLCDSVYRPLSGISPKYGKKGCDCSGDCSSNAIFADIRVSHVGSWIFDGIHFFTRNFVSVGIIPWKRNLVVPGGRIFRIAGTFVSDGWRDSAHNKRYQILSKGGYR